jgi:acetyl esterase
MSYAYEEKLKIAEGLRTSHVVTPAIPAEYERFVEASDVETRTVPTREGETKIFLISPKDVQEGCPLYINIHGGGFVRPHERRDIVFSAMVAVRVGCRVIDIDYKLAPEYPFPVAFNECYDVTKWAFANAASLGVDSGRIALGGHSAGGNLTAAVALMANRTKDFRLALQIIDYAFLDGVTDPSEKIGPTDLIPVERMRAFNALLVEDEAELANPFISPVSADSSMLAGLPPALVISAGLDCFRIEDEKYAAMMIAAGVEVTAKRFIESNHGFVVHCRGEYSAAHDLICASLTKAFSTQKEC